MVIVEGFSVWGDLHGGFGQDAVFFAGDEGSLERGKFLNFGASRELLFGGAGVAEAFEELEGSFERVFRGGFVAIGVVEALFEVVDAFGVVGVFGFGERGFEAADAIGAALLQPVAFDESFDQKRDGGIGGESVLAAVGGE